MIDLRSDTVTLPTAEMLERMAAAPLGDDSRDGDPTVRRLEALAAGRVGHEAALFVPSGTMGNLLALLVHAARAGEVLVDARAHLLTSEWSSLAGVAGLAPRLVAAPQGRLDEAALAEALASAGGGTRGGPGLVWLENSHNDAGGTVTPPDAVERIAALAHAQGLPLHVDGARLFNAALALGVDAAALARPADSVMFCISKGLSAPVGSLLCGNAAFVARARSFRRMLGGNLRQAGVLAAAGVVALESMVERLAEDHRRAREIAAGLAAIEPAWIDPARVQTNIVRVDLGPGREAASWAARLQALGVRVQAHGHARLRLVTHRHVDDAAVAATLAAFATAARA